MPCKPEGAGRRRGRFRGRGAGLSDPAAYRGGRPQGHRRQLHQVHDQLGTDDLKRAIVERYQADYGVDYTPAEVIVSAGGKQALYNAILAIFDPGDEVITHMPGWPTLVEQIKLADATPVIVRTHAEDGFRLHAETFLSAITPRTRGIIINSPAIRRVR